MKGTEYELLITIANAGYTDTIMDAARSATLPAGLSFMQREQEWSMQKNSSAFRLPKKRK